MTAGRWQQTLRHASNSVPVANLASTYEMSTIRWIGNGLKTHAAGEGPPFKVSKAVLWVQLTQYTAGRCSWASLEPGADTASMGVGFYTCFKLVVAVPDSGWPARMHRCVYPWIRGCWLPLSPVLPLKAEG